MPTKLTQRIIIEPALNGFIVAHDYRSPEYPGGDPVGYYEEKLVFPSRADLEKWLEGVIKEV